MNVKTDLTIEDFKEMYLLEKQFYGEDHITPWEETWQWHLLYPDYGAVLEDGDKIVGFLDMFPIKDHIFESMKAGIFNDANLLAEDIADIQRSGEGPFHMFLCCIVVNPEYRKQGAVKKLLSHQIGFYDEFLKKGIEIDSIITDNVTNEGCRFSERLGFQKVTDTIYDSVIYMQDYHAFRERVASL